MVELDKYQQVVYEDLSKKLPEYFGVQIEMRVGGDSLFLGPSERVPNQNLIRVPIIWDHYIWECMREGKGPLGNDLGEPNTKVPHPTSLGCDYLLDLEGKIIIAPTDADLNTRHAAINSSHSSRIDDYL